MNIYRSNPDAGDPVFAGQAQGGLLQQYGGLLGIGGSGLSGGQEGGIPAALSQILYKACPTRSS
ncbi:MAG: hypothetical protein U5J95_12850 [Balneolaceae bacterium]|nr:hypothetical protein [Balneolaceae bacterium]